MRKHFIVATALASFLAANLAEAKPARQALVVSTSWLGAHLQDRNLVLLHVGDKEGYAAQHIPGARHVTLADISVSDHGAKGLRLQMPEAGDLRQRLEKLGISDDSRIVVYYGKDWVSPSTRVIFTLDHAGLGAKAALLDGGMPAWIREGRAVTDVVPAAKSGTLKPLKLLPTIVNAEDVRARLGTPGTVVVDGRTTAFYDGTDTGGSPDQPHRTGHITGALSIPFTEITNDDLMLRSPDALRELFTRAGVKKDDTVIVYCHIGQQATAVVFAARSLGHRALLYDGSFEDWSRHPDYPVEKTAK
jgi:thiosulfate/3-mercaptopyruvate sulfurtransferase